MAVNVGESVRDFENALRRLGWLSAYSRQILMTRHLLRNFASISDPDEISGSVPDDFPLDLFRCSITILTGVNQETQQFSSPYHPLNRPDTHTLAYKRKERIFSASIASGMPDINFYVGTRGVFGFENSTEISNEDNLLSFEIYEVAKNVSLTTKALADQRAEELRSKELWRGLPSEDQNSARSFFNNWYKWEGRNGAFWREWYQGFLEGEPLDWELQRRVALIESAIWKAGAEAVAKEIEKIRATFNLEKHIGELKTELHNATIKRHGIGGNMPPERLDDTSIVQEFVMILRPLEELNDEIVKDHPDPLLLQKIIEALSSSLKAGLIWCLRKGDLMVDTGIKWAIPAVGGYLALNPEKLESVIEAAKKLLGVL